MNRLKELRNEFKYSVKSLTELLDISSSMLNYYENEERNMNANVLKQFSDIYHVSIDYILFNSDNGIFVYYETDNHKYALSKNDFNKYLNDDINYYKNYTRFINLNKKLGINDEISASALLDITNEVDKVNRLFDKANNCKMNIPLNKSETVSKLILLNDEKFEIIKNMIKVMTN